MAPSLFSTCLVKSKELLADLVSGDGHLASALSRKVHALAKEAIAQAHIQENVFLLHRFPYFLAIFSSVPDLMARMEQMTIMISR